MTSTKNNIIFQETRFQVIGEGTSNSSPAFPSDVQNDGDEADLDSEIKEELNVEKEILELKAKVNNLMKFKSRVQQGQGQSQGQVEGRGNVQSAEDGQVNVEEICAATGKNKRDKETQTLMTEKFECVNCFMGLLVLSMLLSTGLWLVVEYTYKHNKYIESNIHTTIKETLKEHYKESLKENVKQSIYFYSKENFGGSSHVVFPWQLNENTCYNLDKTGDDFASSVDTQGECVYVFPDSDCRGKKQKFSSETNNQHDLSFLGLDKKISSLQACHKFQEPILP